jgi:hypothetical protein
LFNSQEESMTNNYGESAPSGSLARALGRFGLQAINAVPNLILLEKQLDAGTRLEIPLSRDSALGGIVQTVECFDLDEVKERIGVPDRLAQRRQSKHCDDLAVALKDINRYAPAALERAYEEGTMTSDQFEFLKKVSRIYVFGYSPGA